MRSSTWLFAHYIIRLSAIETQIYFANSHQGDKKVLSTKRFRCCSRKEGLEEIIARGALGTGTRSGFRGLKLPSANRHIAHDEHANWKETRE